MIRYRHIEIDGSIGCEYTFEREGEYIPSHKHGEPFTHSVLCVSGKAMLEVNRQLIPLKAGDQAKDWDSTKPHTITAMANGTVIVNCMYTRPDDAEDWLADSGVL